MIFSWALDINKVQNLLNAVIGKVRVHNGRFEFDFDIKSTIHNIVRYFSR